MKKGWQIVLIVLLLCFCIVLCSAAAKDVNPEMIPLYRLVQDAVKNRKDPDTKPEPMTQPQSKQMSEPIWERKMEPTKEAKAEPDSTRETEPEAKTEAESEKETEREIVPEPEADTEPEPETETGSEKMTEPQSESQSEEDSEIKPEPDTKAEPESDKTEPEKDDQKVIYEYDEYGEIIGKTVDGIWYIWDDSYGYMQGIRLNEDRTIDPEAVPVKKTAIQMTSVLQLPELPTGCEIVSTYMVLKYMHFPISLLKFTDQYFKNNDKNPDFRHYFVGDPYTPYGLGCYAPCIVKAVNTYMDVCGSDYVAYNYSGYTFEALMNQVAEGYPVIFWATQYLKEPFLGPQYQVGNDTIRWISQEHCMVLTGYDLDKGLATVYDPLVGIVEYDLNKLKGRFLQLGSQAVIIKKADVGYDNKNRPGAFLYDPNLPKE